MPFVGTCRAEAEGDGASRSCIASSDVTCCYALRIRLALTLALNYPCVFLEFFLSLPAAQTPRSLCVVGNPQSRPAWRWTWQTSPGKNARILTAFSTVLSIRAIPIGSLISALGQSTCHSNATGAPSSSARIISNPTIMIVLPPALKEPCTYSWHRVSSLQALFVTRNVVCRTLHRTCYRWFHPPLHPTHRRSVHRTSRRPFDRSFHRTFYRRARRT